MQRIIFMLVLLANFSLFGQTQEQQELEKKIQLSKKLTKQANEALRNDKPVEAEMDYRKAIAKNEDNAKAQYNMGTMYYKQQSFGEAFVRLKRASTSNGMTSQEKHQIFHNLGNTFMKEKHYDRAVESYKEALRNNPTDEETRYNLAVAQDMLKKNPPPPPPPQDNKKQDNQDNKNQNDKNQDNKNQDNQQNQNNKDNKDNKDNQDNKDKDNKENKDNKDKDNKDKDNKENKENQDKDKGKDQKDPQQGEQDKKTNGGGNGQNSPSSLSPQQMERILEAMNNEDKKTQEKIQGQKAKGTRSKSEKDW